jgi:hypothetical protein
MLGCTYTVVLRSAERLQNCSDYNGLVFILVIVLAHLTDINEKHIGGGWSPANQLTVKVKVV